MLVGVTNREEAGNTSLFHTLFVRSGAGFTVFEPLMRWKYWNACAWTMIVALGWGIVLAIWN
jgi:hypothetical protein